MNQAALLALDYARRHGAELRALFIEATTLLDIQWKQWELRHSIDRRPLSLSLGRWRVVGLRRRTAGQRYKLLGQRRTAEVLPAR